MKSVGEEQDAFDFTDLAGHDDHGLPKMSTKAATEDAR
jgi:hypothetical protein